MPWLQISIELARERATAGEAALEAAGALSVTETDAGDDPVLEPGAGQTPRWPQVALTGLFAADTDPHRVLAELGDALGETVAAAAEIEWLEDRDWERAWMDRFKPMRFGDRLWIVPTTSDAPAEARTVVRLDPGLAFGTGTHATTALCLEWLDANPPRGLTVCDYGCGSGILAIAALRLGARHAYCIDNDRQALIATRENAADNDCATRITTGLPEDFATIPEAVDVTLANILAAALHKLAPALAAWTRPGGALVLSGVLPHQAAALRQAYAAWFEGFATDEREGWSRMTAQRSRAG